MKRNYGRKSMIVFILLVFGLGIFCSASFALQKFVSIGSANPGGNWFVMGGGITTLLNDELRKSKGVNFVSESTGGTVENIRRMRAGEMDLGMSHAGPMYNAYTGKDAWADNPYPGLRGFAKIYASPYTFLTTQKTGIKTIEDLIGKEVAVGPAGSGSYANAEAILTSLGIWDKIEKSTLVFADAGRALGDGNIDAIAQAGAPHPYLLTLEATNPIQLITISEDDLKKVSEKYPYYYIDTLAPTAYESYGKPYQCIYFAVYLIADDNLDTETGYEIAKVIFSEKGKEYLGKVHHYWETLEDGVRDFSAMGIKVHEGAQKYFEEAGISIPENIKN